MLYAAVAARVEEALHALHRQLLTGEAPPAPVETLARRTPVGSGRVQELAGRSFALRELGRSPFAGFAAGGVFGSPVGLA